jgi:D-tyrosyl-tRNA(Tyr) deacylase
VLRASQGPAAVYLKVMQPHRSGEIVERHQRLLAAGVPVPEVIAHHQGLVVLAELPGRPLARAVIDEGVTSCRAEDLVALLDRLPASMYPLPLRPPWTDSVEFYAGIVASAVPSLGPRLDALVREIREGLTSLEQRIDMRPHDVVHGDFYEAQVFVHEGKVVGLLDIDTVGPGRRADDLACLLAHLSVLADYGNAGRIDRGMQERVEDAIHTWRTTFEERVDPVELALRSAGVVLSLATGPHRQQEAAWEAATEAIVRVAEEWVQAARHAEHLRLERAASARQPGPATGARPVAPPVTPPPVAGPPSGPQPSGAPAPAGPGLAPPSGSSGPTQSVPPQAPPAQSVPPQAPLHRHIPHRPRPRRRSPFRSSPPRRRPPRSRPLPRSGPRRTTPPPRSGGSPRSLRAELPAPPRCATIGGMRAVLQRVDGARVEVEGEVVGEISGEGLVALVGVTHEDGPEQVATIARKIAELRILEGERSVLDTGAQVLVISQFTLYADVRKGRRPSWNGAAPAAVAEPLVEQVVDALRERGITVATGRFGAHMRVGLTNDGPVTILLEA